MPTKRFTLAGLAIGVVAAITQKAELINGDARDVLEDVSGDHGVEVRERRALFAVGMRNDGMVREKPRR